MFGRSQRRRNPHRSPTKTGLHRLAYRGVQPRSWQTFFERLEERAMLSSVQLDMRADAFTRTWEVFAVVSSDDNAGLAGVAFNVVGSDGLTVNAATFQPPPNFTTQSQNQPAVGQNMSGLQDRNTAARGVGQGTAVRLALGTYTGFAGMLTIEALDMGASVLPTGWQPNMNINPVLADSFFGDAQNIPAVIGDANRDGRANAADFISVQVNFGGTGAVGIPGDANLNGVVNADDFAAVLANLGETWQTVGGSPVAGNDAFATNEDIPITRTAPGVLANDSDPDGDPLTAAVVTLPASGSLSFNDDGSFVYTPNANFHGTDSFTYRVSDGKSASNLATATITINPVNDVAQAVNDPFTTDEDAPLSINAPGVLANDTDADGDPLTAVVESNPAHGMLTLNANGSFAYTPEANFHGTDSFTYRANDGTANSAVATVTITINSVNDAPQAVNETFSTPADTPLTVAAPGVLANDTDADGDPITAMLVTDALNGTVTLSPDGSFTYVPDPGTSGADNFFYRVSDGTSESGIASAQILVGVVAPVAADDAFSTDEDQPLTVPAPGVLANDTDANGDSLTAVLVTDVTDGTLVLDPDGSFTYTPDADFNGTDSFTYRANDGITDSEIATVTITVNAVNDLPMATDDGFTTDEDTPLTRTVEIRETDSFPSQRIVIDNGVLANDTDPDGDALTAVLVTDVTNGTLVLNADGSFTYTPDADFSGAESFTYRANDGTTNSEIATVTITVNAINDSPVAMDDSYTTNVDQELTVPAPGVLGNDTDPDGDPLMAAVLSDPTNGTLMLNPDGSLTYDPDPGFSGTDTFQYQAGDGTAASTTVTVTITVNTVPVAQGDSFTTDEDMPLVVAVPGVLGNDSDGDGDPLTAMQVSGPGNGNLALNPDGSFTYSPNANFNGSDSFSYRANDGTADSEVVTVAITVNAVNDPPMNTVPGAQTTPVDTPLTFTGANAISISDADAGAAELLVTLTATNGTLTLSGNSGLTFTEGDGTSDAVMTFTGTLTDINAALAGMVFTPNAGFTGLAGVEIVTNDQGNTGGGAEIDTDLVEITVG